MNSTVLKFVLCFCLWLGIEAAARAANEGWYGGFNLGSAEVEVINESDLGYKFYGGYLSKYLGAELGVIGLGDGYTAADVDVYGVSFEFVGRVPVSTSFSLLGTFGLFWWTVENCYSGYYYYDCMGGIYDDGSDLTYGLGVEFDVTNHVSIRAQWQEFMDVSDSDVSLISA
ncbi:MAG: outer membrane beta-barrel protein, partial [Gammaproteobacteria bacterium]|nr:outer membrane beta-barrel protein [Gammaproteobacteria bacterium]